MRNKLLKLVLLFILSCALLPAYSQVSIGGGAKPSAVAPQDLMPSGKFFVNTATFPGLRYGTDQIKVGTTCTRARQPNCTRSHGNNDSTLPNCDMSVGAAFVTTCNGGGASLIPAQGLGHTNGNTLNGQPVYTNAGSFRTVCHFSHLGYDDPIVFPNRPGLTHLHQFVGNTNTGAGSNLMTLGQTGRSTCSGGIANRTGYWSPVMVYQCDISDNTCNHARKGCVSDATYINGCKTLDGQVFVADDENFYYKCGNDDGSDCQDETWFPVGHRMISGKATNQSQAAFGQGMLALSFDCFYRRPTDGVEFSTTRFFHIPTTAESNAITGVDDHGSTISMPCNDINMRVGFPQCWDGVNVDSPDHISHMAYASFNPATQKTECPSDHPVHTPLVTLNMHTRVNPQDLDHLRLSSDSPRGAAPSSCNGVATNYCAGLSLHADRVEGFSTDPNFNGWGMTLTSAIMMICSGKGMPTGYAADCHDNLLGDPLNNGVMSVLGDPLLPVQLAP